MTHSQLLAMCALSVGTAYAVCSLYSKTCIYTCTLYGKMYAYMWVCGKVNCTYIHRILRSVRACMYVWVNLPCERVLCTLEQWPLQNGYDCGGASHGQSGD